MAKEDDVSRKSRTVLKDAFVLITGELTLGFTFYGPFDTRVAAGEWAQANLKAGVFHRVHAMQDVRVPNA